MKYKHEFAIKHLPLTAIGTLLLTVALIFSIAVAYRFIIGINGGADIVLFLAAMLGYLVGGITLSDGIEYTKTKNDDTNDPYYHIDRLRKDVVAAAKAIKSIDERREAVAEMDFTPSKKDIEATKKAEANALNQTVLD